MKIQLTIRGESIRSDCPRAVLVGELAELQPAGFFTMLPVTATLKRKPERSQAELDGLRITPDVPGGYTLLVTANGAEPELVELIAFPSEAITHIHPLGHLPKTKALQILSGAVRKVGGQAVASLEGETIPKSFGIHGVDLQSVGSPNPAHFRRDVEVGKF